LAAHPAPPSDTRAPLAVVRRRRRARLWIWLTAIGLVLLGVILVCIRIAIIRAQPILRTRIIETLSARFKSRVELQDIRVWISDGIHVDGRGLKIYGATDPNPYVEGIQPLFEVGEFRFYTTLRDLFREPMRVDTIFIDGLTMNIPPPKERKQIRNLRQRGSKMSIAVNRFVCKNTRLVINSVHPEKAPLEFDISDLRLRDIGPAQPLQFDATLVNPKPVGDIQSSGLFGPINEQSPRDSAVQGTYSFTNANLGTLKGIGGILSSQGQYAGTLGRIEVKGETDTPDFQLTISGHRVPLHTDFHAIVDGTDGDTYLDPVNARVLNSSFTASGRIVRQKNPNGHDIELHVVLGHANIQDLLTLGVKTDPPVMSGRVGMTTQLSLPPGAGDISDRLSLRGKFHISNGVFSNEKVQHRVDALSMRGSGNPKLVSHTSDFNVPSELRGAFTLRRGFLTFSSLQFQVPGTLADLSGVYSLDGNTFDFHGLLKMDAKLSQTTTGWKSILLKPIDPFFHKNGAGTELPFKITGTRSEPHFGLDFGHKPAPSSGNPTASVK
jgi:hypothetical protein